MPSFRFVHAADLHLDTPFEGIGVVDPAVRDLLREASLQSWDALVEHTIACGAALLVVAGDLYDGATRGLRAQLRVLRGLERLSEAGIAVVIVHGNHDPLDGWSAIRAWPDGVTVCGSGDVESVVVEAHGRRVATVHGISYATRDVSENLALRFRAPSGDGFHIGLLHCNAGAQAEHGMYSPCSVADLVGRGFDYWALGHVHGHQVLHERPHVVYAGCLQGRSPKAGERGAKGAVVVEVTDGAVSDVAHVALDRARFVEVPVDIAAVDGLPALRDALRDRAADALRSAAGRSVLLRGRLHGRGDVHAQLARDGVLAELLEDLRAEQELEPPFAWWDSVRDQTDAAIDREALRAQDGFSAALLAHTASVNFECDDYVAAATGALAAGRYARLLDAPDPDESLALLSDAEALAIELLEGGR